MMASEAKTFFKSFLMLDNKNIKGLNDEGLEYPIYIGQFDSSSNTATSKRIHSDNISLSKLSQILIKRACDFVQYTKITFDSRNLGVPCYM